MELCFYQITALVDLEKGQKKELEALLNSYSLLHAKPVKDKTELTYRIKPITEKEKDKLAEKLDKIGIDEHSFQG